MENSLFNSMKQTVKHWWVSLVNGLLAVILGIWCIATPDTTLVALTYLFIFAFLLSGVVEIVFSIANRNILADWGWSLACGIIDIIFGVLMLLLPLPIITVMLIYLIGFWILFRSVWMIGESIELKRMHVKGWGWFLAMAILSILFSFLFIISPVISGVLIVAFVSVAFLTYGIFRIYLALKLRSIHKEIKEIEGIEKDQ